MDTVSPNSTQEETIDHAFTWSALGSIVLHSSILILILTTSVPDQLQPLSINRNLYENIMHSPPVIVEQTDPPELIEATAPEPEGETIEEEKVDEPEVVEEAPAPPKVRPKLVRDKPEKIEPQKEKKLEPPVPDPSPVVVGDSIDAAKTIEVDADAEEGTTISHGVIGGNGPIGSKGTSLVTDSHAKTQQSSGNHRKGKGISGARKGDLRAGYLRRLVPQVRQNYFYPRTARRLGLEGEALVAITINATGRILSVKIYRSSGHSVLDQAATTSLLRLKNLPKPPPQLLKNGTMRVIVPMVYSINS